jgi:hypothetical protein
VSPRPDPGAEIRLGTVAALQGPNYWSSGPVIRLELAIGAYDEISSAEVPGFAERLIESLPGLIEHRCSVGRRGGFIERLLRGTYAPHILEHLALELQSEAGFDVGFGRARAGDAPGEYTVVFEHRHAGVGLRSATQAYDLVLEAFRGHTSNVGDFVRELRSLAAGPEPKARPREHVPCGVMGDGGRAEIRDALLHAHGRAPGELVAVTPLEVLEGGLPYVASTIAIVLATDLKDLAPRFREPGNARRLCSVVAEAVVRGGHLVVPASQPHLADVAREADLVPATFGDGGGVEEMGLHTKRIGDRIVVRNGSAVVARYPADSRWSAEAQSAAAMAAYLLEGKGP